LEGALKREKNPLHQDRGLNFAEKNSPRNEGCFCGKTHKKRAGSMGEKLRQIREA